MKLLRKPITPTRRNKGLYLVEFAIVGSVFLTCVFMVIEFARVLFVFNVLDEVTRRGARLAAVCPVTDQAGINLTSRLSNLVVDIDANELVIEYLDEDGDVLGDPADDDFDQIRFVRARINNYQHQSFFPMNTLLDAPDFQTTLPAESLGVVPEDLGETTC